MSKPILLRHNKHVAKDSSVSLLISHLISYAFTIVTITMYYFHSFSCSTQSNNNILRNWQKHLCVFCYSFAVAMLVYVVEISSPEFHLSLFSLAVAPYCTHDQSQLDHNPARYFGASLNLPASGKSGLISQSVNFTFKLDNRALESRSSLKIRIILGFREQYKSLILHEDLWRVLIEALFL